MQDNNPTLQSGAVPPPAAQLQPDPNTVLNPTPASSLPDPDAGHQMIAKVILAVLVVIAVGIAAWKFVPWPQAQAPRPAATLETSKIEASLVQVDEAFDDLDANMAGVDPALNDVQGNLSE